MTIPPIHWIRRRATAVRELTPRKAVAVIALGSAALLGLDGSPAVAAETTRVNGCEVTPGRPYVVTVNGARYAEANIYVHCWIGRSGIANFQIMEADNGFDQEVSRLGSSSFTIPAGRTHRVGTVRGRCSNFDWAGAEELYAKARINVGGVNSSWAESIQVSTTC